MTLDPVRRWYRSTKPEPGTFTQETVAGLPGAIGSVPDGMAAALLAGVNPIHGLYASVAGRIVGGLSASTKMVVITTTSAAALSAGSSIASLPSSERASALALLTLIAGAVMFVAGLARLGRYTRFVSNSVMIGFLTGVAVNIVLAQIPIVLGVEGEGSTSFTRALDVVLHPGAWDTTTLALAAAALAIVGVLALTRLQPVAALLALAIPTLVAQVASLEGVLLVEDVGGIPTGVPLPALPSLDALSLDVVFGALAVAVIVLVQGAGVSESAPNPDGSRSDANRDFAAQGLGNIAASLVRGQPVGGSVGQTALNLAAGARSRWASIFSGLWLVAILVALSGIVGEVVMATLAAVLIYAAIRSVDRRRIDLVLRTSAISQIAAITTFIATLALPVATAVGIGVALSLVLQVNRQAVDMRLVRLQIREDGEIEITEPPAVLEDRQVVVLDVYGSLLLAGARTLEARLPDPGHARRPAVVLRLRGHTTVSSTSIEVLARYAHRLEERGGRLYLSGVEPQVETRLRKSHGLEAMGPVEVVMATEIMGASSRTAYRHAKDFVEGRDPS
jgi:SulP family sulfate permease